jgi:uncharacterized membrane protein
MANRNKDHYYLSLGIGFGLLAGAFLGVMTENFFRWPGIGMLLGMGIGALMDYHKSKG